MKARAHVIVSGRVQGVFFRSETRRAAKRRAVTGWVRNTPDGKVEAIFEGKREDIEQLIAFCRTGSPAAKVVEVDVQWEKYTGEFRDFEVRYHRTTL
jgi:acylphosphatase